MMNTELRLIDAKCLVSVECHNARLLGTMSDPSRSEKWIREIQNEFINRI